MTREPTMHLPPPTLQNLINGQWVSAAAGRTQEQRDPADLEVVTAVFPRCGRQEAEAAIAAASAAFPAWKALSMGRRAEHLTAVVAVMRRRKDEIAAIITRENGKTLRESLIEVEAGIRELDWQIAEGRRLGGEIQPSDQAGTLAYVVREPLGVVSVICPWNFPFNVPCRKCGPALMAGNTVVMKPASLTPATGMIFAAVCAEAGLPPGVLNCLTGDGGTVGDTLVRHPDIRAVSFTGSTPVGRGIQAAAAVSMIRTQLEMGGKNPAVVLADADLDQAAEAVVLAAFACAGQWCTATSRVLVEAPVHDAFLAKVLERVARIRVGPGSDAQAQMGPVCGESQLRTILGYIKIGLDQGARLVAGGRRLDSGALARGCFIEPTVFSEVTPSMTIAQEEIFGPVLSVIRVDGPAQALALANASEFGLSASVFTRSLDQALSFVNGVEAGLVHVNLSTAHKEPQLPFGGVKNSGFGPPEAGRCGLDFFTHHKTVYLRTAPPATR